MKLLVVNWQDLANPQSGGAEVHLHEIFGRLARRGHDVTLLCSGFPGAQAATSADGMRILRTGGRHSFTLAAAPYYRRHLARERFDVVVEDLNKVPLFTPYWVRRPLVVLVHHLFGATAFREASAPFAAATWLLERPIPLVYRGLPAQAVRIRSRLRASVTNPSKVTRSATPSDCAAALSRGSSSPLPATRRRTGRPRALSAATASIAWSIRL